MPLAPDDTNRVPEGRSFEVCLRGVLSDGVIAELGARRESSDTLIVVQASDRSALHGFIRRVEDLGLELVSVVEVEDE
jgi:hypothetical protein